MNKLLMFLSLLIFCLSMSLFAQESGGYLKGTVLDERGKRLADVMLFVDGTSPSSTYQLRAKTGADGKFSAGPLKPGSYVVYPYKLEDLYDVPDTTFITINPERFVEKPGEDVVKTFHLLPPGGWILLRVNTTKRARIIKSVRVIFCRTDAPDRSGQTEIAKGEDSLKYLVPSDTKISVLLEAQGF
ncbi:MAG: carboxypeptidase-like regulatory domain-containing protein, partial [Acidobacteriaceae bacterium]